MLTQERYYKRLTSSNIFPIADLNARNNFFQLDPFFPSVFYNCQYFQSSETFVLLIKFQKLKIHTVQLWDGIVRWVINMWKYCVLLQNKQDEILYDFFFAFS